MNNERLLAEGFDPVPWDKVVTEPCYECGHDVVFPVAIYPGYSIAKCGNCGMDYADAAEDEDEWSADEHYTRDSEP